jgi:hypothetical protein
MGTSLLPSRDGAERKTLRLLVKRLATRDHSSVVWSLVNRIRHHTGCWSMAQRCRVPAIRNMSTLILHYTLPALHAVLIERAFGARPFHDVQPVDPLFSIECFSSDSDGGGVWKSNFGKNSLSPTASRASLCAYPQWSEPISAHGAETRIDTGDLLR